MNTTDDLRETFERLVAPLVPPLTLPHDSLARGQRLQRTRHARITGVIAAGAAVLAAIGSALGTGALGDLHARHNGQVAAIEAGSVDGVSYRLVAGSEHNCFSLVSNLTSYPNTACWTPDNLNSTQVGQIDYDRIEVVIVTTSTAARRVDVTWGTQSWQLQPRALRGNTGAKFAAVVRAGRGTVGPSLIPESQWPNVTIYDAHGKVLSSHLPPPAAVTPHP